MGVVIPFSGSLTTSGGSGSLNMTAANGFGGVKYGGHIDLLVVEGSSGTMFNFLIKDPNGTTIYEKKNNTTKLLDNTMHLPVRGTNSIEIENADPDDTFTIRGGCAEAKG